jgi:hypothetical protein
MLYAFAILAVRPTIELLGIEGKPITYIQAGELVMALDLDLDLEALKETTEEILLRAVLEHDRVICELYTHHNLLPLRFGTAFVSETALREYLLTNQQELSDRLQQLEGCSEYLLRGKAGLPKSAIDEGLKGKEYLLAKREHYLRQQQIQTQLQTEAQELYVLFCGLMAQSSQITPIIVRETEEIKVHLLLAPQQFQTLSQLLQTWQPLHSHWKFDLSNPLPPYHFTAHK